MTNTDIKKFYNNYLKGTIPSNFELSRDILFDTSINDLLVGFCFEKSGFNKDSVYVWAFVQPLYLLDEDVNLTFGMRLKGKKNGELWHLKNNPKADKVILELNSLMEKEIKGFLSEANTAKGFFEYFKNKKVKNIRIKEALVYSAIYAKYEKSKELLENFIDELKNEDLDITWIKSVLEESMYLKKLLEKGENLSTLFEKNIKQTKLHLKIK